MKYLIVYFQFPMTHFVVVINKFSSGSARVSRVMKIILFSFEMPIVKNLETSYKIFNCSITLEIMLTFMDFKRFFLYFSSIQKNVSQEFGKITKKKLHATHETPRLPQQQSSLNFTRFQRKTRSRCTFNKKRT